MFVTPDLLTNGIIKNNGPRAYYWIQVNHQKTKIELYHSHCIYMGYNTRVKYHFFLKFSLKSTKQVFDFINTLYDTAVNNSSKYLEKLLNYQ